MAKEKSDKESKKSDALKAAEKEAEQAAQAAQEKAEAAAEAARDAAEKAKEAARAAEEAKRRTTSTATEETVSGEEIFDELGKLGSKLAGVVGAAWASEQRHKFEADLREGLSSIANNVEGAFDNVRSDPNTQERVDMARDKAKDVAETVAEKVRGNDKAQDVASGLVSGLRFLSKQLDNLASELQQPDEDNASGNDESGSDASGKDASDGGSGSDEQDIPIKKKKKKKDKEK